MGLNLRSGVKIYDNDWFIRHRLEPSELADLLASWNVTFVIAQSKYLPMQDSAVQSRVTEQDQLRYQALDDVLLRTELRARGIDYFACLNITFDPDFAADHIGLLPIDQWGQRGGKSDWYVGLPPDREDNVAHKIDLLTAGVTALDPDAVHLGFVRWPGFWETWLEGDQRSDKPEYCYSQSTLQRFATRANIDIPVVDPVVAASMIAENHRGAWTKFKCLETLTLIKRMKAAVRTVKPQLEISINTLPFFAADFQGAVTEVFGQDVSMLSAAVDIFEVMAYHQILRRPPEWPAAVASDIRRRSGARALCTVQASPLYLDGMHSGRGREPTISPQAFSDMLDRIEPTEVDGLCIFTLGDLLNRRSSPEGQLIVERFARFRQ